MKTNSTIFNWRIVYCCCICCFLVLSSFSKEKTTLNNSWWAMTVIIKWNCTDFIGRQLDEHLSYSHTIWYIFVSFSFFSLYADKYWDSLCLDEVLMLNNVDVKQNILFNSKFLYYSCLNPKWFVLSRSSYFRCVLFFCFVLFSYACANEINHFRRRTRF